MDITIKFAGDSGDGMQLIGTIFSNVASKLGYQVYTFPSYPADMRAPKNTIGGVSSFQVHFGDVVSDSGDKVDFLICMNKVSYEKFRDEVKDDGMVIIDGEFIEGVEIDKKHWVIPVTSQCKELNTLKSRNIYMLSCLAYYLDLPLNLFEEEITKKFSKKEDMKNLNIFVLTKANDFCDNLCIEKKKIDLTRDKLAKNADFELLSGCKAICKGLIKASETINRRLFLGSYPITPATDILIELEKERKNGVIAVQAEDEIAGCSMAIGASFGGAIGVTSTSGPGMCLKSEAVNLAVMANLPLVIIDVMRGGPSTGLPTKTEQSDLNMALYGRGGDSPVPVLTPTSPKDCYRKGYEAVKLAVEHLTPVIVLMDAYIGNGLEMTNLNQKLPSIHVNNEWINVMNKTITQIGGSESDPITHTISTDPGIHEKMTQERFNKVEYGIESPLLQTIGSGDYLLIGWGGTYGKIESVRKRLEKEGIKMAHVHFDYIRPIPDNTSFMLNGYKYIFVIEQNTGQFKNYIQGLSNRLINVNQVNGEPINIEETVKYIKSFLDHNN